VLYVILMAANKYEIKSARLENNELFYTPANAFSTQSRH